MRFEREGRGWTQAALAERLGVSRQTVVALETGRYDPSLPLAFRIARLFDKPIEQLFFPAGPAGVSRTAEGSVRGDRGEHADASR